MGENVSLIDGHIDEAKDLVEGKQGRWKGAGMGDYYCSLCLEQYSGGNKLDFCPNCNAKMDKSEVEE